MLLLEREQPVAVLERCRGVVDRAGPDDNEESVFGVGAGHNGHGFVAALEDSVLRLGRLRNLMLEEVGRSQGVVAADYKDGQR